MKLALGTANFGQEYGLTKKKVNKKEVAKLKRKVTTTKKQIEKASEAVKEDNADDAVKFLKKFSK